MQVSVFPKMRAFSRACSTKPPETLRGEHFGFASDEGLFHSSDIHSVHSHALQPEWGRALGSHFLYVILEIRQCHDLCSQNLRRIMERQSFIPSWPFV